MKSVRTIKIDDLEAGTVLLVDFAIGYTRKMIIIYGKDTAIANKVVQISALDPDTDEETFENNAIIKYLQVGEDINGLCLTTNHINGLCLATNHGILVTGPMNFNDTISRIEIYADDDID